MSIKVKKLEWRSGQADTPFGTYSVEYDHDQDFHNTPWYCWSPEENLGHFVSAEAAVSEAQADYERRILSAIEPSPDMHEVVSLLETASVALWNAGSNSTAREIDRYLDRVSPDSTAKIDVKLSEAKP